MEELAARFGAGIAFGGERIVTVNDSAVGKRAMAA